MDNQPQAQERINKLNAQSWMYINRLSAWQPSYRFLVILCPIRSKFCYYSMNLSPLVASHLIYFFSPHSLIIVSFLYAFKFSESNDDWYCDFDPINVLNKIFSEYQTHTHTCIQLRKEWFYKRGNKLILNHLNICGLQQVFFVATTIYQMWNIDFCRHISAFILNFQWFWITCRHSVNDLKIKGLIFTKRTDTHTKL